MQNHHWVDGGQPPQRKSITEDQDAFTLQDSSLSFHSRPFGNTPSHLSGSVFHDNDHTNRILSYHSPHYQQALQTLRRYPRSFVHAWLLLAKSLSVTTQRVTTDYHTGSALSIDEVGAIATLKDLPQDQILAWYRDDVTYGLSSSSIPGAARFLLP